MTGRFSVFVCRVLPVQLGETALMSAIGANLPAVVDRLLAEGADVHAYDKV